MQYGRSDYLVEANEYASSSDDFLEQYVASPSSAGDVRAPTPVLYSLPDTFDPRGSQGQETAVKAEPSAADAFVFDSANATTSPAISQWGSCNQVPLRATQAGPEMRAMMGVFRINPFAFHGGPPPPAVAGPLPVPGKHFEWQVPAVEHDDDVLGAASDIPYDDASSTVTMGGPAYGFPLSALTPPRRAVAQAQGYKSPAYSSSSGRFST